MNTLKTQQEQRGYGNFERVYKYLLNKTNKQYDEIKRIQEVCDLVEKRWNKYIDSYFSTRSTQLRFCDDARGGFTERQALFRVIKELAEHIDTNMMLEELEKKRGGIK